MKKGLFAICNCFCWCFRKRKNFDSNLLNVLEDLELEPYIIKNFRKRRCCLTDLKDLENSDYKSLVPDTYSRTKLKGFIVKEFLSKCENSWEINQNVVETFDDKLLNTGSFGRIIEGRIFSEEATFDVHLAVKEIFIPPSDTLYKERLIREVVVMQSLMHKNIVHCFGCFFVPAKINEEKKSEDENLTPGDGTPGSIDSDSMFKEQTAQCEKAFICMELCGFGNLLQYVLTYNALLKEHPERKLNILLQIATGMEYVHAKGIVHRDLKPQNVLIFSNDLPVVHNEQKDMSMDSGNGSSSITLTMGSLGSESIESIEEEDDLEFDKTLVKICDFGSSKHFKDVNSTFCGELLTSKGDNEDKPLKDPSLLDVYSFGILMWFVWTGKKPYEKRSGEGGVTGRKDHLRFVNTIHTENIRPSLHEPELKDCPQPVITIMTQCWDTDPRKRPSGFGEILSCLQLVMKKYYSRKSICNVCV